MRLLVAMVGNKAASGTAGRRCRRMRGGPAAPLPPPAGRRRAAHVTLEQPLTAWVHWRNCCCLPRPSVSSQRPGERPQRHQQTQHSLRAVQVLAAIVSSAAQSTAARTQQPTRVRGLRPPERLCLAPGRASAARPTLAVRAGGVRPCCCARPPPRCWSARCRRRRRSPAHSPLALCLPACREHHCPVQLLLTSASLRHDAVCQASTGLLQVQALLSPAPPPLHSAPLHSATAGARQLRAMYRPQQPQASGQHQPALSTGRSGAAAAAAGHGSSASLCAPGGLCWWQQQQKQTSTPALQQQPATSGPYGSSCSNRASQRKASGTCSA